MKLLLFIALIVCSFASWRQSTVYHKIETLKKNKGWAGIVMQMAELHTEVGGPIDELIVAIEKVVEDLKEQLENAHTSFAERTGRHDEEVGRLSKAIMKAKTD